MEIYKDIQGFEGLYQVSNLGNIKALAKNIYLGRYKALKFQDDKILNKSKTSTGYWKQELYKNTIGKSFKVHRLVAQAFIPNPEKKPEINHIDGNPLNNRVDNLEWATPSENRKHSFDKLGRKNPMGYDNILSKECTQLTMDGIVMNVYGSIKEASRKTGVHATNIGNCINGIYKQSGGFIWR